MPSHFESIAVISDLHFSPTQRLGNFSEDSGRQLVKWTREQTSKEPRTSALVLAGDIVDFLLVEGRKPYLDLQRAECFVDEQLQSLSKKFTWATKWRDALEAYWHAGGHLVLLPGNHDPEWLLPEAAKAFKKWVCHVTNPPRLQVCLDETWQAQVEAWRVTVLHGDRHDPINEIDREGISRAVAQGKDSFRLPPGSDLVLGPLHHFKQATDSITGDRRFPFLDSLKPELPGVAYLLMALDPILFGQHMLGFAKVFLRVIELLSLGGNVFLGSDTSEAAVQDPIELLAAELAAGFVATLPDRQPRHIPMLLQNVEEYLTQSPQTQPTLPTLGSINRVGQYFLRAWLENERTKSQSAAFFDKTKMDAFDKRVVAAHLLKGVSQQVIVAGHSHAAREVSLPNDCRYLNTGTWTDLTDVTSFGDSDRDLELFVKHLEDGTLPKFTRLTWAEITPSGAILREFVDGLNESPVTPVE